MTAIIRHTIRERLNNKRVIDEVTGCWIWTGLKSLKGYGIITIEINRRSRNRRVHRLSYAEYVGPIDGDLVVCHRCDTPSCFNPDHLFLGSHKDNVADRCTKGRTSKGSRHGSAKITEEDVSQIRQQTCCARLLADKYGVSKTTIHKIKSRDVWKHVP